MKMSQDLFATLELLRKLNDAISVLSLIKATNLEEERQKWCDCVVKNLAYNPKFEYNPLKIIGYGDELSLLKSKIDELPEENARDIFIKQAIGEGVDKLIIFVNLAKSIEAKDDEESMRLVRIHLGHFDTSLVRKAKAIIDGEDLLQGFHIDCKLSEDQIKKAEETMLGPGELAILFSDTLQQYGFASDGWVVKTGTDYQNITVETKMTGGMVYVPTTRKPVKLREAIALVGHEIECHVRHNMNTAHLFSRELGAPIELARFLASRRNSILTEGLAKVSDITVGLECGRKTAPTPEPWYVFAENMAMNGATFAETGYEIYTAFLKKGEASEKAAQSAWKYVSRTYRGCTNCRNPKNYAWYGDKCYLEGFLQATELLKVHPSAENFGKLYVDDFETISKLIGKDIDGIEPMYPKLNITEELIARI